MQHTEHLNRHVHPSYTRSASPAPDDRFRLLVESIRDYAIFLLDPDGWITTWNAGAERIKGYALEEIIGRHFSVFYPPEDRERGKPEIELKAAIISGRFEDEGWRLRKDGSRFWAHVTITALRRPGGELIGFAKVTQDLTQRRQMEEMSRRGEARLSGIIASAMDAIISVNEEQRIVLFNAAAEEMFRYPANDAIGRPLELLIPPRFRGAHAGHIRAFGETGVTSRSMWRPGTLWALRSDGVEFPIEATISQVEAAGQKIFTVILRDISERVRQEQRVQEALAEAQQANQVKADFLTMMSHELRTPLNAIAGYAQLLEMGLRGPVTPEQREDLQRIQRNQHHLLALINNILNFARLEAGQLEYTIADVRLDEEIAEVSALAEPQMRAKRIEYEAPSVDPDLAVRADVDKLRQILLNLLSNAAKFTDPGGRVSVECVATPDQDQVLVNVRDTGSGIPADKLEKVFEPFVQLERSLTASAHGTGLGLAISRDLARGMGGDLTVESTVGQGSTFTLRLPRATRVAAGPPPLRGPARQYASTGESHR